uniref:RNA helicase n=1 Tax=Culicoides sonorensis TaxID=179676 RepID=A0A336L513_CULSO
MSEAKPIGHDIDSKVRTIDVEIDRNVTFEQLMLTPSIIAGLKNNNFIYPSPIQLKAIPLARCGKDLLVQAKSGTGKTLVFAVTVLERFFDEKSKNDKGVQSLVLVPTREIALQVTGVIESIGKKLQNFNVISCIGGTDVEKDRKRVSNAKCVVGTPGRIIHLIRNRMINPENIKLVVLDEADKLLNDSFTADIKEIMEKVSNRDQTLIVSATLDDKAQEQLLPYMKNPLGVTPKKESPILIGITQFIYKLPRMENVIEEMQTKLETLVRILTAYDYNQCLVFTNSQSRAESYANGLHEKGFLAEFISGALDQNSRTKVFERILTSPTCRIIVTTDLLARGIDAERVNLVVNMELPSDQFCYLHRIGRAGRFGSLGAAITFVSEGEEILKFKNILYDHEHPVYTVKEGDAGKILNAIENGTVPEHFETFISINPQNDENSNENEHELEPTEKLEPPGESLMKIFDLYKEFVSSDSPNDLPEDEIPVAKTPVITTTNNIFLQKIMELNLYGDDDKKSDSTVSINGSADYLNNNDDDDENENASKSEAKSNNDSTKSNIDSGSSSDNIQESDLNDEDEKKSLEFNLNTESANERVDNFLDTLDNLSQNMSQKSPSGSHVSATTYTIEGRRQSQQQQEQRHLENKQQGKDSSGSDSDDERSKSPKSSSSPTHSEDSTASNRGSDSYQNEIDDTNGSESTDNEEEEEYFDTTDQIDHHPQLQRPHQSSKSPHGTRGTPASAISMQQRPYAYNRWTNMYWNQANHIVDYVNYWKIVRQQNLSH